jgi:hypothetical protein
VYLFWCSGWTLLIPWFLVYIDMSGLGRQRRLVVLENCCTSLYLVDTLAQRRTIVQGRHEDEVRLQIGAAVRQWVRKTWEDHSCNFNYDSKYLCNYNHILLLHYHIFWFSS